MIDAIHDNLEQPQFSQDLSNVSKKGYSSSKEHLRSLFKKNDDVSPPQQEQALELKELITRTDDLGLHFVTEVQI